MKYTLNGLPLDDPQGRWYLHERTGVRIMPGRRSTNTRIPGRDGVLPSLGSGYEPGAVALTLSVRRASHPEMMAGIELLYGILGQRGQTLSLVHDYGNGQKREAQIEVLSMIQPERLTCDFSRLDVQCSVPGAFWRDLTTVDAPVNMTGTQATATLSPLAGTTAPINDALIRFRGGFSAATITDPVSGDQLTINQAVTSTQYLVVDTANWVARLHSTDSWSLSSGSNVIANIVSNRGAGTMLSLNPDFSTGNGRIRLTVKGTNVATSPTVTVRAKRAFL